MTKTIRSPSLLTSSRELSVEGGGKTVVSDLWLEHVLPGDEWMLAARIVPDRQGYPVIAELRVFPFEVNRSQDYAGRWSAETLGVQAQAPVGGLPASLLHRTIRLTEYERLSRQMMTSTLRLGTAVGLTHPVTKLIRDLKAIGFQVPREKKKSGPPRKDARGRAKLDDREYARVAMIYATAFEGGKHPVAAVAQKFGRPTAWAKSRIARAREYGFLSSAKKHGKPGGYLTQKGLDAGE